MPENTSSAPAIENRVTLSRELVTASLRLLGEGEGDMDAVGESKWLQEEVWICERGGTNEEVKGLLLDDYTQHPAAAL